MKQVLENPNEVLKDELVFEVFHRIVQSFETGEKVTQLSVDFWFPDIEPTKNGNNIVEKLEEVGLIKRIVRLSEIKDKDPMDPSVRMSYEILLDWPMIGSLNQEWRDELKQRLCFIPEKLGLVLSEIIKDVCNKFYADGHNASQLNSQTFQDALFGAIMSCSVTQE